MKRKYSLISMVVALTTSLYNPFQALATILDSAESFAVLGSTGVNSTGLSTIVGNIGASPGTSIVGFNNPEGIGIVNGTIHGPGQVSLQAMHDAGAVWTGLQNMAYTSDLTGEDLGNRTLKPGVYHFDASAQLTGDLILDAGGLDNAFWAFLIGSTLTTAPGSTVTLVNPGANNGLFWQVGSTAILGKDTLFIGNILADQSVTLINGAGILCGRIFTLNGAVTMDANNISAGCGEGDSRSLSGGIEFDGNGDVLSMPQVLSVDTKLNELTLLGLGLLGSLYNRY